MADKERRFPAQFDDEWWEADLARSSPAGQRVAEETRKEYQHEGMVFRPEVADRQNRAPLSGLWSSPSSNGLPCRNRLPDRPPAIDC